jgi:hypothetical protein
MTVELLALLILTVILLATSGSNDSLRLRTDVLPLLIKVLAIQVSFAILLPYWILPWLEKNHADPEDGGAALACLPISPGRNKIFVGPMTIALMIVWVIVAGFMLHIFFKTINGAGLF